MATKRIWHSILAYSAVFLLSSWAAHATVFGTVRGIVHDPQHRPVAATTVTLKAKNSSFTKTVETNTEGEFHFDAVPLGEYTVSASTEGLSAVEQTVTVLSGAAPILHIELRLATQVQSVTVTAESAPAQTESVTPTDLADREEIRETPGASRSNSLAMITNTVPGAYLTHDQLHVRGGHQVSWLIDGVPIPNTNIASNLGPQIDPKDIDVLEMQRGSYAADFGDRTYAVFNVAPRTGFERNNEAEFVLGFGNFLQTDNQINFGGHTNRFAYYGSVTGNRTDLGLQTPTSKVLHDRASGAGGFASLIYNADARNQLRLVSQLRRDFYQVPFDPDNPDNSLGQRQQDANQESDGYAAFSWVHTFNPGLMLTISPFAHANRAAYVSNPSDLPLAATDDRHSKYEGGQATVAYVKGRHNARAGVYGFAQQDDQLFDLASGGLSFTGFPDREAISGSMAALFAEEEIRAAPWLTLSAGVRQTHFSGGLPEDATSPRFGAAVRIPKLKWVLRGFYGRFYQAPPLLTASGPLLQFVNGQNLAFIPLHGERDEEHQFGVNIPLRGWTVDADTFRTRAANFFDHNCLQGSGVCFPITIEGALIRGWELTLRSPRLLQRGQIYLTYSNQVATGSGGINGGLTDFAPGEGAFLLDHDQRNTLHTGGRVDLPRRSYASLDVYYGSGFANGNPPPGHLTGHTTFDVSLGKDFGGHFSVTVTGLNVANRRVMLDNSETFGGTHWLNPREFFGQVRYRFHY